jgi:hypothetical protein
MKEKTTIIALSAYVNELSLLSVEGCCTESWFYALSILSVDVICLLSKGRFLLGWCAASDSLCVSLISKHILVQRSWIRRLNYRRYVIVRCHLI